MWYDLNITKRLKECVRKAMKNAENTQTPDILRKRAGRWISVQSVLQREKSRRDGLGEKLGRRLG